MTSTTFRILMVLAIGACGDNRTTTDRNFTRLIEASWTLPPLTNQYVCAYLTVDEDLLIDAFRPVIPVGTHHTVLSMGEPNHADGVFDCGVVANAPNMIFGSGVGTGTYEFPSGVAVEIPAGKQLVLNLHLFNASDA